MSKANGKTRPAWMGSAPQTEQEPVDTAPAGDQQYTEPEQVHTEGQPEAPSAPAEQAPVEEPSVEEIPEEFMAQAKPFAGRDHTERIEVQSEETSRPEPEPLQDYAGSAPRTDSGAPSFGKKTMGADTQEETTHPRPASFPGGVPRSSSSAPTRVKAAIQGFVERISGKRTSNVPGGEDTARSPGTESPEQVEKRLRLSLRETTVEGFKRICFGSQKGGIGKSSLAYTAAATIASTTNLRVCLVDADPNVGATRYLVPRPVNQSVLDLADDADRLERLADLHTYVSQNEQMGLDILLNPIEAAQISGVDDLAEAYARVDAVLSRFYNVVIYDLGPGFRDEAIRRVLGLSDELVLISDADVIPNAQLPDTLRYVEGLGVNLQKTTLVINHGRPPRDESASTTEVRREFEGYVRRVTEVPYDAALSRLLNTRAFHIEKLALPARLGVLTTAAAALEGLRRDAWTNGYEKVLSLRPDKDNNVRGGR